MIIFFAVISPLAYLNQTYGLENIPHYNLQMWCFYLLYGLFCLLGIFGIVFVGVSWQNSEEAPEIVEVPVEEITEEPVEAPVEEPITVDIPEEMKTEEEITEEEAPAEVQDQPVEETVEIPAEWLERKFE